MLDQYTWRIRVRYETKRKEKKRKEKRKKKRKDKKRKRKTSDTSWTLHSNKIPFILVCGHRRSSKPDGSYHRPDSMKDERWKALASRQCRKGEYCCLVGQSKACSLRSYGKIDGASLDRMILNHPTTNTSLLQLPTEHCHTVTTIYLHPSRSKKQKDSRAYL
jgi:hypothetical protein